MLLLLLTHFSLFDANSYREAVINAFVHNNWESQNAPMFTFYSDRIEILSHGALSPKLTLNDFYKGKSEPKNRKLPDIFLQLHISERTGRGVPTILKIMVRVHFLFLIIGFKLRYHSILLMLLIIKFLQKWLIKVVNMWLINY